MKVKIKENTRYGMGEAYREKSYCCPKCGKEIMYYNGVTVISGSKQKFCHNCGTMLGWDDIELPN